MNDEAGFLRSIKENRDELSCRLVYADWLEERGDARGEYLRLSCRMAELREQLDPDWLAAVKDSRFHPKMRLSSGRVIRLDELRQFWTYACLIEGLPVVDAKNWTVE
jgi:uncharacterized protein (TIGR02996 family)